MLNLAPPRNWRKKTLMTAITFAFASPVWAIDINSWDELESNLRSGETEFSITSDLSATHQITSGENVTIDLQGHGISTSLSNQSPFFFTKGLTLKNSGTFLLDEETGEIVSVTGGIFGLDGAVSVQGSAMNQKVSVDIENVVFSNSKGQSGAGF